MGRLRVGRVVCCGLLLGWWGRMWEGEQCCSLGSECVFVYLYVSACFLFDGLGWDCLRLNLQVYRRRD